MPTSDEIQAQLDKQIKDLDTPSKDNETTNSPTKDDTATDTTDTAVETKADDTTDSDKKDTAPATDATDTTTADDTKDDTTTDDEKEDDLPDIDTRYKESAKEARKLAEDSRMMNDAIKEANALGDPTDEDLTKEYSEWDMMSDTEKRLAKDNYINKRRFEIIAKAEEARNAVDEWRDKIDNYIEDPKTLLANPELEGKEAAFKEYANRKEFRSNNLMLIVGSFITDQARIAKEKQAANKGKQMETGKGGDKAPVKPKSDKISVEQSAQLRQDDYPEYLRLLQAGKISDEIV